MICDPAQSRLPDGANALLLPFPAGVTRKARALDGTQMFDINGTSGPLAPHMAPACDITRTDQQRERLDPAARLDASREMAYLRHGNPLQTVLRRALALGAAA